MKERINLNDSTQEIVAKMSDGNPGAISVCIELLKAIDVDPDSALGSFGSIILLDSFGIYGTEIYILHNDICKRDIVKTIAVIRSCQLGIFDAKILKDACGRQDRSGVELVPVEDLYQKVKEKLPNFDN